MKSFKISARSHDIVVTITDKKYGAKKNTVGTVRISEVRVIIS